MTSETITWIPVSERLPDERAYVLIAAYYRRRCVVSFAMRDTNQWIDEIGHPVADKVTHWAETPKGPWS